MSLYWSRAPAGVHALLEVLRRWSSLRRRPVCTAAVLLSLPLSLLSCSEGGNPLLAPDSPRAAAVHGDIGAPSIVEFATDPYGVVQVTFSWADALGWDLVSFTPVVDNVTFTWIEDGLPIEVELKNTAGGVTYAHGPMVLGPALEPGPHEVCVEVMAMNRAPKREKATTHHNRTCATVEVVPLAPPTLELVWLGYVLEGATVRARWSDGRDWPAAEILFTVSSAPLEPHSLFETPYAAGSEFVAVDYREFPPGPQEWCATARVGDPAGTPGFPAITPAYASEPVCITVEVELLPDPVLEVAEPVFEGDPVAIRAAWTSPKHFDTVRFQLTVDGVLQYPGDLQLRWVDPGETALQTWELSGLTRGDHFACVVVTAAHATGSSSSYSAPVCQPFVVEAAIANPAVNVDVGEGGIANILISWSDDRDWPGYYMEMWVEGDSHMSTAGGSPYTAHTMITLERSTFRNAGDYRYCAVVMVGGAYDPLLNPRAEPHLGKSDVVCTAFTIPTDLAWVDGGNGSEYALLGPLTWTHARNIAMIRYADSHLLTLESQAESDLVRALFDRYDDDLWIGYNDLTQEGVWEWQGGQTSTWTNWYAPPNGGTGENAAAMNMHGTDKWDDLPEDRKLLAILERPALP